MQRILTIALVAPLCACSAERAIYSSPGVEGNVAEALAESLLDDDHEDSAGAGSAEGGGLRCPPLPEGRPLMPSLSVGWAVEGERTLLQFGSHAFACAADIEDEFARADACPALWAFEIDVDIESLEPLERTLGPEHPGTLVHFERSSDGLGCSRDTIHSSSQGFTGTLLIHAVDDDCIVGEFIDLGFPTRDISDLSGVFVAERC